MNQRITNTSADNTSTFDENEFKKMLEINWDKTYIPNNGVCPHCGRCPVCGRKYNDYYDYYPWITWC